MKTIKKFTHLLLAMWLCIGMMTTTVFAAVSSQDGVEVTLTTDKESYEQGESITATVTVTNKNEVMVTEVSLESIIPEGYKLADGSEATKQVTVLAPGETVTLTVTYVADIANSDTDKSEGDTGLNAEDIAPPTGDEISGIIWVGLLVLAGAGIVAVIATRKGKKVLSAFMSIVLAGMVLSGVPIQAKAAETNGKTIYVTETVTVAGRNVQLNATVGYQIDGNQSEGDEPTDAGEISYKEPFTEHVVMDEKTGNYYVDNQVLITAEEGTTRAEIEQIISQFGGVIVGCIEITDDYQVELPVALSKAELEQIVTQLNENDAISLALIHDLFELQFDAVPNDSEWSSEEWSVDYPEGKNWGVEAIDAMGAWDYVDRMNYVKVGIMDTMFDMHHEDLVFTKVWNNPDSIYSELEKYEPNHGTHVAGTIAACYNNGKGITGVAPKVTLYGYSLLGTKTDVVEKDLQKTLTESMEIKYALAKLITSGCKVINCSLGETQKDMDLELQRKVFGSFLYKLIKRGYDFVIVQAAGNDSISATENGLFTGITIAEVVNRVIVVGAVETNGSHKNGLFGDRVFDGYTFSAFSGYGERVDVVAPGAEIYSTIPYNNIFDKKYQYMTGTSMAAPHVSGIAAMCFSVNPTLSGEDVKSIIVQSSNVMVKDNNDEYQEYYFKDYIKNSKLKKECPAHTVLLDYPLVNARLAVERALNITGEAVSPVNPSKGIVMGNIRGNDEADPDDTVPKKSSDVVSISAYKISNYDGSTLEYSTLTQSNANGNYELVLEPGEYYINIYKNGYLPYVIRNVNVVENEIAYLDNVLLIPSTGAQVSSELQGTVRNAMDGSGIEGVTVRFRPDWNNRTGELAKIAEEDSEAVTTTDETGHYLIRLLEGCYTVEVVKDGYIKNYANAVCTNMDNVAQDVAMTPILSDDEYRIVLTWSSTPSDLDSHISGPLSDGGRFHVLYSDMSAYDNDTTVAMLDLDDTDSYGPETITLKKTQNGTYRYAVHDFSNRESQSSKALSMSGAKVTLYRGNALIATYNVPINTVGTVWNVFEISGNELRSINTFENISSSHDVCAWNGETENSLKEKQETDSENDTNGENCIETNIEIRASHISALGNDELLEDVDGEVTESETVVEEATVSESLLESVMDTTTEEGVLQENVIEEEAVVEETIENQKFLEETARETMETDGLLEE